MPLPQRINYQINYQIYFVAAAWELNIKYQLSNLRLESIASRLSYYPTIKELLLTFCCLIVPSHWSLRIKCCLYFELK